MDIDALTPGVDFDEEIRNKLAQIDTMLVLIGPRWADVADQHGMRRLDDPGDYVRLEIAFALEKGIRVIPVLVGNARLPKSDTLPSDIGRVARRHAIELSDSRWDYDTTKLINAILPSPSREPVPQASVSSFADSIEHSSAAAPSTTAWPPDSDSTKSYHSKKNREVSVSAPPESNEMHSTLDRPSPLGEVARVASAATDTFNPARQHAPRTLSRSPQRRSLTLLLVFLAGVTAAIVAAVLNRAEPLPTPPSLTRADFRVRDCDNPPYGLKCVPEHDQTYGWNLSLLRIAYAYVMPELSQSTASEWVHKSEHLNDGWYSPSRSWIPATESGGQRCTLPISAVVNLRGQYFISAIALSNSGPDRGVTRLKIGVSGDGTRDETIYDSETSPLVGRRVFPTAVEIPGGLVTVIIESVDGDVCPRLDEIEVYGDTTPRATSSGRRR